MKNNPDKTTLYIGISFFIVALGYTYFYYNIPTDKMALIALSGLLFSMKQCFDIKRDENLYIYIIDSIKKYKNKADILNDIYEKLKHNYDYQQNEEILRKNILTFDKKTFSIPQTLNFFAILFIIISIFFDTSNIFRKNFSDFLTIISISFIFLSVYATQEGNFFQDKERHLLIEKILIVIALELNKKNSGKIDSTEIQTEQEIKKMEVDNGQTKNADK